MECGQFKYNLEVCEVHMRFSYFFCYSILPHNHILQANIVLYTPVLNLMTLATCCFAYCILHQSQRVSQYLDIHDNGDPKVWNIILISLLVIHI